MAPMHCAVVGAGIAGLGAAISLRRAGHDVEIFERSSLKQELGAAITMTPNANRILNSWGFDAKKAKETDKRQSRRLDPATLEVVGRVDLSNVPKHCDGHKFNAFHRVDLHNTMRELALSPNQPGPVPKIFLSKEVAGVHGENGTLEFKNGNQVQKDLIVLADGISTIFVEAWRAVRFQ